MTAGINYHPLEQRDSATVNRGVRMLGNRVALFSTSGDRLGLYSRRIINEELYPYRRPADRRGAMRAIGWRRLRQKELSSAYR